MKKFLGLVILVFMFLAFNTAKASTCPFSEQLELGSKNESVGILQEFMLNTLKIYTGPITNYFGPLTMASVKVFQESSGLLQTGKVDLVTASALCKIYLSYKTTEPISDKSGECFLKTLGIGKGYFEEANEEVKQLQMYLNKQGVYPENIISGYFGSKTELALKSFQTRKGLSASGIIDDATFKAICGYENNQSSYCPFVTENLSVGYFEEPTNEVKTLQMILSKLGVLEEKYITGYFGNITKKSVEAMQTKSGLTVTGTLTLETRQSLCKMLSLPMRGGESSNPNESADSKIDLTISGGSILPEKIDVGTKVAIVVKVKNIGSESSSSIKGSLYMNDKEIVKANISTIKSNEEVVGIVHNWTCDQKGIYALKIFIDSDNALVETKKHNNVSVLPINCGSVDQKDYKYSCNDTTKKCEIDVAKGKLLLNECQKQCVADADLPDLTITKFSANKTFLKPNEVAIITIVEKNIGKTTADYHKAKMTVNGKAEEVDWSPLDPGSSNTIDQIKFTCTVPGFYTLTIETDSSKVIKETNENNNTSTLEIKCADKDGKVPINNDDTNDSNDNKNDNRTDTGDGRDTGGSGKNRYGDGTGSGSETNTPPSENPTETKIDRVGVCGATNNLNVGAKLCTSIYGRNNSSNPLPKGITYFQLFPLDTINCVDKKDTTGKCSCCRFYRAGPHRAEIVLGGFYCEQEGSNCAIDFGDGTPVENWTKKDREYIDDGNEVSSTWSTKKVHFYEVPAGKDYAIFCPKLIVGGKYYKLTNSFINDYEDKEKCIIVFRPNFVPPPYSGVVAPWEKYEPGTENCNSQVNFASNQLNVSASGSKGTVSWVLSVLGGEPYLQRCPAVCVVSWGDGKLEQILPCPLINSISHTYAKPGKYTVRVSLNGFYDQDPNSKCITKEAVITVTEGDREDAEKKYNCVDKKCVVDSKGPYKTDTCDNKCEKSDTPPADNKNDIGVVCEIKQTAKPIPEAVSVEMTGKIKSPGTCKSFTWHWDNGYGTSNNIQTLSFYDNDPKKTTIDINMSLKAVCDTDGKIYGTTACIASFKKDAAFEPSIPNNFTTTGGWFDNVIKSILGTGKVTTQGSTTTTLPITKTNPSFNLQAPSKSATPQSQSFNTGSLFNFNSLGSNTFNPSVSTSTGFNCDLILGRCVPAAKGIYTKESICNASCSSGFTTSSNFNFSSLNLTATTQANKYKCDTNGKCVKATNLDKTTYTSSNCDNKCTIPTSNVNLNSSNTFNSTNNMNLNINFNQ